MESSVIVNPNLQPSPEGGTLFAVFDLEGHEATSPDLMTIIVLSPFGHPCRGESVTFG